LPDQHTIAINLAHAVKRDVVHRSILLDCREREAVAWFNVDARERHADDSALNPVVIAERETAPSELGVPANPVEK